MSEMNSGRPVSPDGQWEWDGYQWVPHTPAGPPPPVAPAAPVAATPGYVFGEPAPQQAQETQPAALAPNPYGTAPYGGQAYPGPAYQQPYPRSAAATSFGSSRAYAHWIKRVGAYFLDSLLVTPLYIAANVVMASTTDPATGTMSGTGIAIFAVLYLVMFGFNIWNTLIFQGRTGQTLGKKWLRIKTVSEATGGTIGIGANFVRQLCHILDALPCYLGFFWPLWDAKRQTFADKIMKTVVVDV